MRIPQEIIEEIKYRCDIVDVVSSYVTLKRAGSNMNGLCPFHSEKSPSFTVFPGERNFYCFGCGAGGDVITFVMKAENLDYRGALEFLAKRAGITIPQNDERDDGIKKNRILDMNRDAAKYFHGMLNTQAGSPGMEYLLSRGLSMATIKHFGLGYAPNDFGATVSYLKGKGYTDEEMKVGFLCGISQKSGRPYDYFRNRVMFPIIDVTGNVIAFGGRVLDDSKPKYLNTSDTPAFKKSRNLFALNFAKKSCAEQMILCEGYMDVIALHAAGFTNAVATLGTAITPEQARIMKRYTKSVIISYDSDAAGQNAADKAFKLLGEVGLETRILRMDGAKDPDEYIKKFGALKFKSVLEGAGSRMDFKYNAIISKYDLTLDDDKIKAAGELAEVLAGVYSEVERDIYIRNVAAKLDIPAERLRMDVDRIMRRNKRVEKKNESTAAMRTAEGWGDRINTDFIKNPRAARAEESILGMLQLRPELIRTACGGEVLKEDDFFTEFGKRAFRVISANIESGAAPDNFAEHFNIDESGRLITMKINRSQLTENGEGVYCECVAALRDAGKQKTMNIEYILSKKRRTTNE
ncbi:MAG: DNA primase [Clostridia bacterium]|nr:DNA primase [Clostridia bacterium]